MSSTLTLPTRIKLSDFWPTKLAAFCVTESIGQKRKDCTYFNSIFGCGSEDTAQLVWEEDLRGKVQGTRLKFSCPSEECGGAMDGEIEYPFVTANGYLEIPRPAELVDMIIRWMIGLELSLDPLPAV